MFNISVSINHGGKQDVCHDIRTGQNYLVGQSWQLDQCTTCYCGKSGKAACALQMCERDPKCKDLLIDNNECCPKCKDENGKHCSYFALFRAQFRLSCWRSTKKEPRRRNSKIPWPLQWANNEEYSQSKMFSKCLSIVVLIIRIWFIPSSQFPMCFWYCESPFFILVIMLAAEITVKYALRWLKFISWATNLKLEWVRPKGILTNQ